jgi:hypothetical protein
MNRSDLHGGLWVHRSLLDSALRRLRRVEREIRVERHLTGMCLMGVYLIGVYLTGMHLMGVYLIGVYLTGVHLMVTLARVGRRFMGTHKPALTPMGVGSLAFGQF